MHLKGTAIMVTTLVSIENSLESNDGMTYF